MYAKTADEQYFKNLGEMSVSDHFYGITSSCDFTVLNGAIDNWSIVIIAEDFKIVQSLPYTSKSQKLCWSCVTAIVSFESNRYKFTRNSKYFAEGTALDNLE